ncbi:C4-dicarboxylate ABC transporter substrate-binding protein [Virgibacillus indicus]|uniref:C4-dicarboxylate ABC transporter substrate-binding protein n=1 Tax=Virgibacillus indicus TaxID=2024554 RepID=A0A265N8G4_9BACI|nr:TRAP transporter substrate-binding protein [Virgibacillus indicus]OZU88091.1 C4-dicarboxylate ABC transporter substrate-binding protein [Virgibacillus indicus]
MKKTKTVYILLGLVIAVLLSACGNDGTEGEDGKIKIVAAHNQTSPDSPYQAGLLKFKEVAEEESNGSIEVEVHAGTIGTEESQLVEKLQLKAADVVVVSPGFMTQTGIKEVDLFSIPYIFTSYEHWESAVDGEVGEKMADIINEKSDNSFKLLGYWTAGVRHYYGKKPLESIDDLKGMSLRTQTSGVIADFWKTAGAIPSSISWGELYQGLQQDVVDSSENAYPFFVQQNHHTTPNGKYITETAHDYTTRFLLINGEKFDSYSKEHQEIILKAAEESVKAEREANNSQEVEYKEKAIEDGAEVNQIDREPFIEIAKPIQDEAAKEMEAVDLLQDIRDLAEEQK